MAAIDDENSGVQVDWAAVLQTTLAEVDALMMAIRFSPGPLEERAAVAVDVIALRRALLTEHARHSIRSI